MICQTLISKYTCPACSHKTCSLECYRTHKSRHSCSGKVDVSRFIKQDDLASDPIHLNRDYNLLQSFDRAIDLSKKDIRQNARNILKRSRNEIQQSRKRFRRPGEGDDPRKKSVLKVFPHDPAMMVKRENTLVIQVPSGMQRASSNKSGYDKKSNCFVWTIEWIFVGSNGKELALFTTYRSKENLTLQDLVPKHILDSHGMMNGKEGSQLGFYLKNALNTPKNSVLVLEPGSTLSSALKDKIVLEYPTIYVATAGAQLESIVVDEKHGYDLRQEDSSDASSSESSSSSCSSTSDSSSSDDDEDEGDSEGAPEESTSKPSHSIDNHQREPGPGIQVISDSTLGEITKPSEVDIDEVD
ncbi:uncharacterized protein LODBEIA_P36730 [Lodderomyces beijingensis]|uniref:HIT-type domain-containing protein n=1 Tax=Lodderomyces beijingensis TaxID=1775926 RepID=A0ABP0ZMS9_9ASCO